LTYFVLGIVLFFPWGITTHISILSLFLAFWFLLIKLLLLGSGLALFEILSAKLRLFRAPEFLTVAFLLAIVGVFTQTLMWK
jgi:formate hydrogenlyase subunit 4